LKNFTVPVVLLSIVLLLFEKIKREDSLFKLLFYCKYP